MLLASVISDDTTINDDVMLTHGFEMPRNTPYKLIYKPFFVLSLGDRFDLGIKSILFIDRIRPCRRMNSRTSCRKLGRMRTRLVDVWTKPREIPGHLGGATRRTPRPSSFNPPWPQQTRRNTRSPTSRGHARAPLRTTAGGRGWDSATTPRT